MRTVNNKLEFLVYSYMSRYTAKFTFLIVNLQMCVRMSKLEFFCNRPTIVALISFGLDISSGNKMTSHTSETSPERPSVKERTDEKGRVKGLLGFGKERVVFYLNMNVDSVTIFLNKEDDSQLAKLVQESFLMDLKVMTYFLLADVQLSFLLSLC